MPHKRGKKSSLERISKLKSMIARDRLSQDPLDVRNAYGLNDPTPAAAVRRIIHGKTYKEQLYDIERSAASEG